MGRPERFCDRKKVAGVHGREDRGAGRLVERSTGRPAFADEDRGRGVERPADQAEVAALGAACHVPLRPVRGDELQRVQRSGDVAERHHEVADHVAAKPVRADALSNKIWMIGRCRPRAAPGRFRGIPRERRTIGGGRGRLRLRCDCRLRRARTPCEGGRARTADAVLDPRLRAVAVGAELPGDELGKPAAFAGLMVVPLSRFRAGDDDGKAAAAAPAPLGARAQCRLAEELLRQPGHLVPERLVERRPAHARHPQTHPVAGCRGACDPDRAGRGRAAKAGTGDAKPRSTWR